MSKLSDFTLFLALLLLTLAAWISAREEKYLLIKARSSVKQN